MKIAVFHNLPFGGAKRVLYEQIKHLSKKHDIYLYQLSDEKDQIFKLGKYCKEVNIYKFDTENNLPGIFKRFYTDYKKFIVLKKLHENIARDIDFFGFDIVLAHPDRYTQSPYLLRYLKTKRIYYCHELLRIAYEKDLQINPNLFIANRKYEKLYRYLLKLEDKHNARCADLILANSKYIKEKIKKYYNMPSIVCYPGVDITFFKNLNLARSNILFLGNSKAYNFKLPKLLNKKNYNVKNISFSKDKILSDENLRQEYNKAIVTVCITAEEPFGMIPIESMACQTPVIAVNDGGYRETIIDKKTGFLVKNDKHSVEKILYEFLHNNAYNNMGKQGRVNVSKRFTWTNHVSILENTINKLV